MSWMRRLFARRGRPERHTAFWLYVRCHRCGEAIRVRTLSAEGRLSAWILTLVPILLFGVLWITTPSYLPPLLDHPTGQKMIAFAVAMMVIAVFWMRKIIRIDL